MTPKFIRMAAIYKRHAPVGSDLSDEAMREMFNHETHGEPLSGDAHGIFGNTLNGFALGKKYLNVTISMWREDWALGLLSPHELVADGYPEDFVVSSLGLPCLCVSDGFRELVGCKYGS